MSPFASAALCLHLGVGAISAGNNDHRSTRDQWLSAVKSSVTNYPSIIGRMTMSDKSPDLSKQLHWDVRFAVDGKRVYIHKRNTKRVGGSENDGPFEGREGLWIGSAEGCFLLKRPTDDVEYSLVKRFDGRQAMDGPFDILWEFLLAGTRIYRCPFVDLLQDPGFEIVSEATSTEGTDRIARIRFTLDSQDKSRLHIRGGEVELLADRSFALRRAAVKVGKKGDALNAYQTQRIEIDYGANISRIPFPRRVVISSPFGSHSAEIHEVSSDTLPDSAYAEATYGIDLKPAAVESNRFWVLLACGIVLSIIAAVGLRAKRSSQ